MRLSPYLSVSGILLPLCVTAGTVRAQVTIDGSVPTRVETIGDRTEVTGGALAGTNLFHSFREFSVPTGQIVHFDNPVTITNIINRVTGASASLIDGTIGANGAANVFLINPNGIIFGANARLNIGGSFLATTANRIRFADGSEFNAVDSAAPVLSVSVPIGLQFGSAPKEIVNRANDSNPFLSPNFLPAGLRVPFGRTIALVGGDVRLESGNLTAYGGRIAIGSVGDHSFVSLDADGQGWRLGYGGVSRFGDIRLSTAASLDASGSAGTIDLQGQRVTLAGSSQIIITTIGQDDQGNLTDGSSATGDLTVIASDEISLTTPAGDSSTAITTQSNAGGNSGNIYLNTARLTLRDGSVIGAGTIGTGNAGQLVINASEFVEIVGVGQYLPSFLTTSTAPSPAGFPSDRNQAGNGGNIKIKTGRLSLRDGGAILAVTADNIGLDGSGRPVQVLGGTGGTIEMNAADSIEVSGTGRILRFNPLERTFQEVEISSSIATSTGFASAGVGGSNTAGSIRLNTARLRVVDGGEILVNSFNSTGAAGNLSINAGAVSLENQARMIADSSSGSGGNITIDASDFLSIRRNSTISANAGNNGDGGNITINTPFILAVPSENSDITANAEQGTGGNVTIATEGIFGIEFRQEQTDLSDITVSSRFAGSGTFSLTRLDVDPQGEVISSQAEVVDPDRLIVRTCGPGGRLNRGEFTITGRGGLPSEPDRTLEIREGWVDFGDRAGRGSPTGVSPSAPIEPIVEARGWIVSNGQIVLTDRVPAAGPVAPALSPADCHFDANRS